MTMNPQEKKPGFSSEDEAQLYEQTPKWILWKALRSFAGLADPCGVDLDATGPVDADRLKRMRAEIDQIRAESEAE